MKVFKVTLNEDVEKPFSYFARKRDAKRFELKHDEIEAFDQIEVRTPYELADLLEEIDAVAHKTAAALADIHAMLDGTPWNSDDPLLKAIARRLRDAGFEIKEPK